MISVAMTTYNGERFLEEQLDSLSGQTKPPAELVVCDDQSVDRTVDIVRHYARNAPFEVRLIVNEQRLGYRANFMKAASLCRSEFIAFCDQDDVWLSDKLASVERHLSGTNRVFLQHGLRLIDEEGRVTSGDVDCSALEEGAPWTNSLGLTQAFSRSLLSYWGLWNLSVDQNYPKEKMGHDQWVSFIGQLLGDVVTVPDVLVHYRQHGKNTFGYAPYERQRGANLKENVYASIQRLLGNSRLYDEKRSLLIEIIGRYAAGANSRISVIEAILPTLRDAARGKLLDNLAYYRKVSHYQSERLSIYGSKSKSDRLRRVSSLYLDQSYQYWSQRGIKDSVLDVLYGVAH